jgi:hypothetical protein
MRQIKHNELFLSALRTALIFIAGFLSYEILKLIENEWNQENPKKKIYHLSKRKIFHFCIIYTIDIFIIYLIVLLFDVHL